MKGKVLKRVLTIGTSKAIILPSDLSKSLPNYVWVEKRDSEIVIKPAIVEGA